MILLQVSDAVNHLSKGLEMAEDNMKALQSTNHLLVGFLVIVFAALIVVYVRSEKKDKVLLDKEKADNELRKLEVEQRIEESKAIGSLAKEIAVLIAKIDTIIFNKK